MPDKCDICGKEFRDDEELELRKERVHQNLLTQEEAKLPPSVRIRIRDNVQF